MGLPGRVESLTGSLSDFRYVCRAIASLCGGRGPKFGYYFKIPITVPAALDVTHSEGSGPVHVWSFS